MTVYMCVCGRGRVKGRGDETMKEGEADGGGRAVCEGESGEGEWQ